LKKPLIIDFQIALEKASKYCAYQERCQWDVERKLNEWNVDTEIQDEVVANLITEGFLNEERFSKAYTQGKVNIKRWGKYKVRNELKARQISNYSIEKAFQEIDEEIYLSNLRNLIEAKRHSMIGNSEFEIKMKLIRYLISKGYETELINKYID
jgi:regulatory protein